MAASSATRTAHSTDAALDGILARLAGVARSGAGYSARCPAHDDRAASLSIGTGEDGRVLLCCHAGCATEAVVSVLGLDMRDLFTGARRARAAVVRETVYVV